MLIIELIRWLFGYVNFTACDGFADRFINLCTKAEIPLWNIQNIGGKLTASTTLDGYIEIRHPARKSGMRVRISEKKGLVFFLKKHKKRIGLLVGATLIVAMLVFLSQFIWSVSVVGNTTIDEDLILETFEEYGVKVGARITKEEIETAEEKVGVQIPELSWVTVNRKGAVAVIEVREKVNAPEMYDKTTPTNLVASEDGVVLGVDILYGNAEVKIGSAVAKGDLLISGVITHPDYTESLIHADGHVKALVKKKNISSCNSFDFYKLIEEKTKKSIFFFGLKIPLGLNVPQSFYTKHNSFIETDEILLPVGIITEYGATFNEEKTDMSEEFKNKIALLNNALYIKEILDYCEIKTSYMVPKSTGNVMEYEFYAECEQEIGTLQEIYIEKTDDIA